VISTHFESIQLDNNNSKCNDDPDNINHPRLKPERTDDDEERHNTVLDDILLDCDIADSCLMPRTFWIDPTMQPRCNLEQMAYDISSAIDLNEISCYSKRTLKLQLT
jgi:hypothetical protein